MRTAMLRRLHEDTTREFVLSPGFGVGRMIRPSPWHLKADERRDPGPIPQPGPPATSPVPTVEGGPNPYAATDGGFYQLHRNGLLDFADPVRFGYVKDRGHVAGFRPHAFGSVPGPADRWELRTLDLVGLLLHEEPVAYVSAHLPRMDELREAPNRPPDAFEAAALERLRRGEDLVVAGGPDEMRMLGSVRSARECVGCHGGQRGDLLGAFSYTLRRADR
jgi:hypothetical protein